MLGGNKHFPDFKKFLNIGVCSFSFYSFVSQIGYLSSFYSFNFILVYIYSHKSLSLPQICLKLHILSAYWENLQIGQYWLSMVLDFSQEWKLRGAQSLLLRYFQLGRGNRYIHLKQSVATEPFPLEKSGISELIAGQPVRLLELFLPPEEHDGFQMTVIICKRCKSCFERFCTVNR